MFRAANRDHFLNESEYRQDQLNISAVDNLLVVGDIKSVGVRDGMLRQDKSSTC